MVVDVIIDDVHPAVITCSDSIAMHNILVSLVFDQVITLVAVVGVGTREREMAAWIRYMTDLVIYHIREDLVQNDRG